MAKPQSLLRTSADVVQPWNTVLSFGGKVVKGLSVLLIIVLVVVVGISTDYLPTSFQGIGSAAQQLWTAVRQWVVGIGWLAAALFAILWLNSRRRRSREKDRFLQLLNESTTFQRDHQAFKMKVVDALTTKTDPPPLPDVAGHFDRICTIVAQTFELITKAKCHCSLKLFVDEESDHVSTKSRDSLAHNRGRGSVDEYKKSYPYRDNTAFKRIIDEATSLVYMNNNLAASAASGDYVNSNPDFPKHYNSVLVAPVTEHTNPAAVNRESCDGFLTIDSLKAQFDEGVCKEILRQYALWVHDTIKLLGKAK